ncbi:MAG: transketolase family protein [Actinomycetia bacterium]|nr:transketolase family protein [Actinomycetes bacterium]
MVAIREAFGKALLQLGENNKDVVVLDADLASSTKTTYFAEKFPERFFQCGIAEQNMIGVAAGLASCGKIPFVASFAVFVTKRPADQISISVAYPRLNVKIIGAYTGLFNGKTGASHAAVEDISIMRAIPEMVIIDPADAAEMKSVVNVIANYDGPVYMRETRDEWPDVFDDGYCFEIGKASVVRPGDDASIISSGVMTSEAIKASQSLLEEGINVRVINMATIKPIDSNAIIKAAEETGAIVTAENHNIYGGLGSAVAEVLVENHPVPMQRIGIKDVLNEAGTNQELLDKFDMSYKYIMEAVKNVIARKKIK